MTITVQVSDFRNNMAMYLGKLKDGYEIDLKKGSAFEGRLVKHPKTAIKEEDKKITKFLTDVQKFRVKYGGIKMKARTNEELVNEIDRIVYGVDRNGQELSDTDR